MNPIYSKQYPHRISHVLFLDVWEPVRGESSRVDLAKIVSCMFVMVLSIQILLFLWSVGTQPHDQLGLISPFYINDEYCEAHRALVPSHSQSVHRALDHWILDTFLNHTLMPGPLIPKDT